MDDRTQPIRLPAGGAAPPLASRLLRAVLVGAGGLAGALAMLLLAARGRRPLPARARLGLGGGALALALVAGATGVWAAGAGGHAGHDPAAHADQAAATPTAGHDGDGTGGHGR